MMQFLIRPLSAIATSTAGKTLLTKLGVATALLLLTPDMARADGIYMTNMKTSLTPSSVTLLTDPARPGGVQAGDIVEYVLQAQVANAAGGPGVYFTTYIPNGVEVLGAWFVTDATGATVRSPGQGGHAHDGWGPRGSKTPFGAPFAGVLNSRQNDLSGDTGIFYSTDPRTQLFTADSSGIAKGPIGNPASTSGTSNGYNVTDTFYKGVDAFNLWDADQVNAFGAGGTLGSVPVNIGPTSSATVINSIGQGASPFGSGSTVAGPQTGYTLDNTGLVGPWQRIQYPGSQIANITDGPATAVGTADTPTVLTTTAGVGLSDVSPLPTLTNAVRWSYGLGLLNEQVYIKVRVRVNAAAIASSTQTLLNFEANGSDNWGSGSKDNPWRYFGPTIAQSANLFVAKEIVQVNGVPYLGGTIVPGATVTYRVRYLNLGNLPVKGVTFTDKLAAAIATTGCTVANPTLSGLSNSVTATVVGGTLTCPTSAATVTFSNLPNVVGGSLGALRGGTFTYNVKISPTVADNVTVANTATLSAKDAVTSTLVSTSSTAQFTANKTTTTVPDLTLTKTHSGNFSVGAAANYGFTVKNIGNLATNSSMTVKDTLPTGLSVPDGAVTVTGANAANWSCTALSNVITCTSTVSIAAGGGTSMFGVAGIQVGGTAVPSVTNQATIAGGGETNASNNTASDVALVNDVPDLTVIKQSVGPLTVGKIATYTFTVKNIGKGATMGPMTTSDLLPAGLTVPDGPLTATGPNGADWSCASLGGDVDCTSTVVIPGNSSSTFTLSGIQINPAALPTVTNPVTVVGGGETNLTNNGGADTSDVTAAASSITISGTAFRDADADVTINGSDAGTNAGSASLTIYAVDSAGKVVDKTTVAADGTYSLTNISQNASVVLRLSNDATVVIGATAPTAPSLPTGWFQTGKNLNGVIDGTIATLGEIVLTTGTSNIINQNLGIRQSYVIAPDPAPTTCNPDYTGALTTGIDATGGQLPVGSNDLNWTVEWISGPPSGVDTPYAVPRPVGAMPAVVVGNLATGAWLNEPPNARWISYPFRLGPNNNGFHTDVNLNGINSELVSATPGGTTDAVRLKFTSTVTLPSNANTVAISLPIGVAVDNQFASLKVNGVENLMPTPVPDAQAPGFFTAAAISLQKGWQPGINTVEIVVDSGPDYVGFFVKVDAVTTQVCGKAQLPLVKRITAINGNASGRDINGSVIDFTQIVDDSNTNDDNDPNWPGSYLKGAIDAGVAKVNDELEYTIYFLSNGTSQVKNALICDRIPSNATFLPTAFSSGSFTADPTGLPGAERGIALSLGGSNLSLSNIGDGDGGQFFPAGVEPTTVYPKINCGGPNTNGAVVVNLGDLPNATAPGAPIGSSGFVRFKARVK